MLLPTTLPRTTAVLSARHDRTLTASSGALVPKATTVRSTTSGGMPSTSASREAPRTRPCAPSTRIASPPRISVRFTSMRTPTRNGSRLDEDLEAAVAHALEVERHLLRHRLGHARVLHDLRVHLVAVATGLVDDVGEDRHFSRAQPHQLREGQTELRLHVVPDALDIGHRPMLHPHPLAPLCHLLVGREILLRHRDQEAVDVAHPSPLSFEVDILLEKRKSGTRMGR